MRGSLSFSFRVWAMLTRPHTHDHATPPTTCVLSRKEAGDMGELAQSASAARDAEHMNKPANAQHVVIKYIASLAGIAMGGTLAREIRKQHTRGLAVSHSRTEYLSIVLAAATVVGGRDPPSTPGAGRAAEAPRRSEGTRRSATRGLPA